MHLIDDQLGLFPAHMEAVQTRHCIAAAQMASQHHRSFWWPSMLCPGVLNMIST